MIARPHAAAFFATLGCLVAVACTSSNGGGGIDCATASPCRADAPAMQAEIDQCNRLRTDTTCGVKYSDLGRCVLTNTKCGADNKTDTAATSSAVKASCSPQISAYQTCQPSGSGDGGASSSGGSSSSGASSSGSSGTSSSGTSGANSSGSSGSSSGGAGACGSITWKTSTCSTCMDSKCCTQQKTCTDDAACATLLSCLIGCAGNTTCSNDCAAKSPGGVSDYNALSSCFSGSCSADCQ